MVLDSRMVFLIVPVLTTPTIGMVAAAKAALVDPLIMDLAEQLVAVDVVIAHINGIV